MARFIIERYGYLTGGIVRSLVFRMWHSRKPDPKALLSIRSAPTDGLDRMYNW
ncbi:hypothetical protein CCACVL1_07685 [Corchorus capsularis]|uniref:Uncharacterized protein n=1 Tax=Corchorus capsularis TaxID=210143 RepID=A0A1R3J4F0_COCAP|nr:hypothetical protein CCACVL1_07685 [Corchorus capsularis]